VSGVEKLIRKKKESCKVWGHDSRARVPASVPPKKKIKKSGHVILKLILCSNVTTI
jgi:hypothetical protein